MTDRLPVVSSKQAIRAFEKLGFRIVPGRGKGSHTFMTRDDPRANLTVPNQKEIKRGLLRGLIRAAGISADQFVQLLK